MPKRPRQAHIPSQVTRRAKPRRPAASQTAATPVLDDEGEPIFADAPSFVPPAAQSGPVDTRPHRRLELLTRSRDQTGPVRVVPGQLPTFERSYLMRELRQISLTAGSLLAVIIALTFILR